MAVTAEVTRMSFPNPLQSETSYKDMNNYYIVYAHSAVLGTNTQKTSELLRQGKDLIAHAKYL